MRTRYDLLKEGKPLTFQVPECNTPCTAELEVRLEELAKYLETRAKETRKVKHERSDYNYYYNGAASGYEHAAMKIREVLDTNATYLKEQGIKPKPDEPQVWITEYCLRLLEDETWYRSWYRSGDKGVCGEFPSETAALKAIAQRDSSGKNPLVRRARRIA